jgi:hypothetical protein
MPERKKTPAPQAEPVLIVPASIPGSQALEVAAKMPEATQPAVEPIQAAPMNAPTAARAVEAAPPLLTRAAPMVAPTTTSEVEAAPAPVKPAPRAAPAVAREVEAAPPTLTRVAPTAAPTATDEAEAAPVPIKPAPMPVPAREVEAVPVLHANPYFFREREEEEEEELLLTVEVNDSSANTHKLMTGAPSATAHASTLERKEPHLSPTRISNSGSEDAALAPNQAHAAEGSAESVVEPAPWPSISDRRLGAPIPQKEHGTGTPPRRSWWRRSIGHRS